MTTGSQPIVEHIELSPATVIRNGIVLMKRYWAVTDPAMLKVAPPQQETEDNEPHIVKQYITDRNDMELDGYERGQEIYCVLESENMDNENVDIDLSQFEISLLYRGKILQNNILKDYVVSTKEENIPLQVIPEDFENEQ